MGGFDEAWLRSYTARRAAAAPVPATDAISFTLCRPTPLLNVLLRMHWRSRQMLARSISAEIARLVPDLPGRQPLEHARVSVTRFSTQVPDQDNLMGCKIMIDALLVLSKRHPNGLGLIRDDDPAHLTLVVQSERCATRREQRTEVVIKVLP